MKRTLFVAAAAVLGGVALAAEQQSQTAAPAAGGAGQMQGMQQRAGMEGGVMDAAAISMVFTVEKVDQAQRSVTLKAPDGATQTFKLGPEVRNFDQIKQGDQVRATVVDEIAVGIGSGGQAGATEKQAIAVAPKGAKPGMVMIQTERMTGKILAVDPSKRMVSLEMPSGEDKTVKVGSKVNLDQLKKGETITLQVAQGMAITVQSPETAAEPAGAAMPSGATQQPKQQPQ